MGKRVAVVLFNLGGPDRLQAVRPFLLNLFNDPAIIGAPRLVRAVIAQLIVKRRIKPAIEIYRQMGGGSPLRKGTEQQAQALEKELQRRGWNVRVFVCMRYWHPMSDEVAEAVEIFDPEETILLPLYPQFSTTTTGSSLSDWRRAVRRRGYRWKERAICCYPAHRGLIAAHGRLIREALRKEGLPGRRRLLFSAHGLPEKIIARGDPYVWQVQQTVSAVVETLESTGLDCVICYQSRVGPMRWTGPQTEAELVRAGREGVAVVVVPISFVSEHSETLVELDIAYRELATKHGVPMYIRVPTIGVASEFIEGLGQLVESSLNREGEEGTPSSANGQRICPMEMGGCPCR
jgi:ferrochelatase